MESDGDCQSLLDSISTSLVAVTRTANRLAGEDIDFHRSLRPELGTKLDKQNARLLDLAQRLLGNAASGAEVSRPRLSDADSVDENWRRIVDVLDNLLEKADTSLDEYSGAVKRMSPGREQTPTNSPRPSRMTATLRTQDLPKPQLTFQHVPANDEVAPFVPLIATKPHAVVPLKDSLTVYEGEDELPHVTHPYLAEIRQYEYTSFVYTRAEPITYQPFATTTATLVDTEEALDEMLQELKKAKEIAIDLEHHDYRSYIGLVSLMQISTRDRDWIVDTLKPWRRKLSVLNEVFADPNILKVLHGAHMDIIWLQRDLGLYIVGLFDTHHGCRVLGYPGGSLAFLLKKFVDFDAQKQYQTADWRIRPLPTELFDYARSDTHFLLYIYDNMRNELIDRSSFEIPDQQQDKVHDVLMRSKDVALQTYNHPVYDPVRGLGASGWYKLLSRTSAMLTKEQFCVFRYVHQWRDQIAREQDDSIHYVLSNHHLFSLAKEMPLERAKVFNIVQPLSQTIKLRVDELLEVIARAKSRAGDDIEDMRTVLRGIETHLYGEPMHDVVPARSQNLEAINTAIGASSTNAGESAPPPPPTTSPQTLRSPSSALWGSSFHQQINTKSTLQPRLYVPMPPLTAEIYVDPATVTAPSTPLPKPPTATTTPVAPTPEENEIFTLRNNTATKRKASDALATNTDEVTLSDDELSQRKADKAARKAERKAVKRAKKAEEFGVEEGAFDYANASSVLHGAADEERKRDKKGGKDRGKGGKEKEVFSLAKGLGDVGKGLGRRQRETAGRSMTFK